MNKKKLLLPAFLLTATLTIASCSSGSRNTSVPYGSLDLTKTIASSETKDIKLSLDTYYAKLRNLGYNLVTEKIKSTFYADEVAAVKDLLFKNYSDLTKEEKISLSYDGNEITEERFDEIKDKYYTSISDALANSIISTTTYEGYNDLKPKEDDSDYEKAVYKYIQSQNLVGYSLTDSNISFVQDPEDDEHILLKLDKFYENGTGIIDTYIIKYAEEFYTGKELYKIAGEEYILDEDSNTKSKNSYYYFKDEKYETTFNNYYKTYGTYKAIAITFASRKEAMETIEAVFGSADYTIQGLDDYLKLYNTYYASQKDNGADFTIDSDKFTFVVDKDGSELSKLDSGIRTLLTDVLEDGEFLIEPRNLSGNYVLVYKYSTVYDASGTSSELEWKDLDATTEAKYEAIIRTKLIEDNISSYISTVYKKLVKNSDLKIYDPIFEAKFYNSYTDQYNLIDKNDFKNDYIFSLNDTNYTVEDFYKLASVRLGLNIVNTYFEQAYAANYIDDYLTDDTKTSNSDSLEAAIDTWKKGNNATYSKNIGLENFLVATYGFKTQDEVLKYYFNAKSALSSYLAETIQEEWAVKDTAKSTDDTTYYTLSDSCKNLMNTLLSAGNSTYEDIFSINIDHILISIDFDNDGTPDDPEKYLAKHPDLKADFEEAVNQLAKAIYTEAINEAYQGNSLYSILNYIVEQYNKGNTLRSGDLNGDGNPDTWDDYKTIYRFSLRAEQLASSGDITQSSVSNFVVPFADYVKALYKKANDENVTVDEDYGVFYTTTDGELKTKEDVSKVSINTLCQTVYGYHLLVLNSYDGPDSLKYSASSDDPNGYQAEIKLLISEDEDDSSNNIYITIDSYNEDSDNAATLNQFFIYYVENQNGTTTSLDSKIYSTLQTLFSSVITTYTSNNFQTLVLLDEIDVKTEDAAIATMISENRQYLVDQITSYGDDDDLYAAWCDITNHSIFKRENQK